MKENEVQHHLLKIWPKLGYFLAHFWPKKSQNLVKHQNWSHNVIIIDYIVSLYIQIKRKWVVYWFFEKSTKIWSFWYFLAFFGRPLFWSKIKSKIFGYVILLLFLKWLLLFLIYLFLFYTWQIDCINDNTV